MTILTETETRIAQLIGRRLPYERIADDLGIDLETVRAHVAAISGRLPPGLDQNRPYWRVYRWANPERYPEPIDRSGEEDGPPRVLADRQKARGAVARAIFTGRMTKPTQCPRCHREVRPKLMHAHHTDYLRPLDVEWLCVFCHNAEHRQQSKAG